jgi:hypothetical protein
VGQQPLGAGDLDPHVLAAGGEDLLVEHAVAGVGRHGPLMDVVLAQRRQDADHDQAGAHAAGGVIPVIQAGADLALQLDQRVAVELAGRQVDLQVELPHLGGPGRIGERAEHLLAPHRRHAGGVHEIQLDLLAHQVRVSLEPALPQHGGERLQRAPHLVAVDAPVLAADLDRLDVTTHEASLVSGEGDQIPLHVRI